MKHGLAFFKHPPLKPDSMKFLFRRSYAPGLFASLLLIMLSLSCSELRPHVLRGTGISSEKGLLLLTLNAGLLEVTSSRMDADELRRAMQLLEEEFGRANDGMALRILVDQPSDAAFVMERMSKRYRLGPLPQSVLDDGIHAGPDVKPADQEAMRRFRAGIRQMNPYYIEIDNGGEALRASNLFRTSGLQIYAGGQVHYDLLVLSHPVLEDRSDRWVCCQPEKNMPDMVLLPAPGRSALDGVAVATVADIDQIRTALQTLIGASQDWTIPPERRSLLRLYAARNGELGAEECAGLSAAHESVDDMPDIQRLSVQEALKDLDRYCSER